MTWNATGIVMLPATFDAACGRPASASVVVPLGSALGSLAPPCALRASTAACTTQPAATDAVLVTGAATSTSASAPKSSVAVDTRRKASREKRTERVIRTPWSAQGRVTLLRGDDARLSPRGQRSGVVPGAGDTGQVDELADDASGVAGDERVVGHVLADDRPGGDEATGADRDAREDDRAGADPGAVAHPHRRVLHRPALDAVAVAVHHIGL